jgi:hypothetical protein
MFSASITKARRVLNLAPRAGAQRGVFQHAAPITPTHLPKVTQLLIDGKVSTAKRVLDALGRWVGSLAKVSVLSLPPLSV